MDSFALVWMNSFDCLDLDGQLQLSGLGWTALIVLVWMNSFGCLDLDEHLWPVRPALTFMEKFS